MVVGDGGLSKDENRVHFGAWCIMSSPMILAFNLSDSARREIVWDIITNKEAIQVIQAVTIQAITTQATTKGAEIFTGRRIFFVLSIGVPTFKSCTQIQGEMVL